MEDYILYIFTFKEYTCKIIIWLFHLFVKPVAVFAVAAGMKRFELAAAVVGDASPKCCFGCNKDNFGFVCSVILCFLRLLNISAPLNFP